MRIIAQIFITGLLRIFKNRIAPPRIEINRVNFKPRVIPKYGIKIKPPKKAPRMLPKVFSIYAFPTD
jgi:hypothetical protein